MILGPCSVRSVRIYSIPPFPSNPIVTEWKRFYVIGLVWGVTLAPAGPALTVGQPSGNDGRGTATLRDWSHVGRDPCTSRACPDCGPAQWQRQQGHRHIVG
jgi:hypothetical protein